MIVVETQAKGASLEEPKERHKDLLILRGARAGAWLIDVCDFRRALGPPKGQSREFFPGCYERYCCERHNEVAGIVRS